MSLKPESGIKERKKDFPLYDLLAKEVSENKAESKVDAQKMSVIINSLSKEKMDIVMALIYHHSLVYGAYIQGKTPYSGKIFDGTKGVRYQIKDLPENLLQILWIYINGPSFK